MANLNTEFGKRCERCRRIKPSRMYYRRIMGIRPKRIMKSIDWRARRFRRVCVDCWEELESQD